MEGAKSTLLVLVFVAAFAAACAASAERGEQPELQVLFVCEHGNVKSLMAAAYFNQMARWTDVPPASVNFDAARDSLKAHVARLIDRLARSSRK